MSFLLNIKTYTNKLISVANEMYEEVKENPRKNRFVNDDVVYYAIICIIIILRILSIYYLLV